MIYTSKDGRILEGKDERPFHNMHQWDPVLYNTAREEIGWICKVCGMNAQREPEEKNMEERNKVDVRG